MFSTKFFMDAALRAGLARECAQHPGRLERTGDAPTLFRRNLALERTRERLGAGKGGR